MKFVHATFLLAAAAGAAAVSPALGGTPASGTAPLYAAAQAASGAKDYAQNCSRCHGAQLEGISAPPLKGSDFTGVPGAPGKLTVHDVFKYMTTLMPAGNAGSLSHETYAAIMAYILEQNGNKPGAKALTYEAALASTVPIKK